MRRPLPQPARGPHRAAELRHPARTAPPVMLICFARLLRSSPADGDTYGERVTAQTRRDCRVLGEFRIGALCSDPCTARDPVQLTERPCPGKWKTHPCVSDSHLNEGRSGDAAHHVAEQNGPPTSARNPHALPLPRCSTDEKALGNPFSSPWMPLSQAHRNPR